MNDKDIFEISELAETEEIKESEIIELEYETEPVETWETVEPNIRVKKVNGVVVRYEVKIDFGRQEVYSKKKGTFITRQDKRTKSFKTLKEAQRFKALQLAAKSGKVEIVSEEEKLKKKKHKFADIADEFYKTREKLYEQGKISESYLQQYRIQTEHFKKYFNKKDNTYIEDFDTNTIEQFYDFKEEKEGKSRNTLIKYRTHLNQIWSYIVKNKKKFGTFYNVVADSQITTKKTDYEALALDYNVV